ncbi:hypothetical protein D3C87_1057200 [compost metagenome]
MSNHDRFQTPYHLSNFPDPQDKKVIEYSTCSGCGEVVTTIEIAEGEVLDIYGMCVHDNYLCIKDAVQARTIHIDEE